MKRVYENLRDHIIDTTSVLTVSNPLFAISENILAGLSDEISLSNRINGSILFYLGAGSLFAKGRDIYHSLLNISEDSKYKGVYDALWGSIFGAGMNTILTGLNSGSLEETISGTIAGGITGAITGLPSGYAIDLFRDLTEIAPSTRMPEGIKNLPKNLKKGLATGLTAASIASVFAIYKLTPDNFEGLLSLINGSL